MLDRKPATVLAGRAQEPGDERRPEPLRARSAQSARWARRRTSSAAASTPASPSPRTAGPPDYPRDLLQAGHRRGQADPQVLLRRLLPAARRSTIEPARLVRPAVPPAGGAGRHGDGLPAAESPYASCQCACARSTQARVSGHRLPRLYAREPRGLKGAALQALVIAIDDARAR